MYPKDKIVLNEDSPVLQQAVVAYFKQSGIPVEPKIVGCEESHPWLYWDPTIQMLRRIWSLDIYNCGVVKESAEEFLNEFTVVKSVRISKNYTAIVDYSKRVVTVGSQKFDFDEVFETIRKYEK